MANREKTYEFVQAAFRIGHEDAVDAGMLAGSYFGRGPDAGCRVARVRERLSTYGAQPWLPGLVAIFQGMKDEDRIGRFRALHTPWSAGQITVRASWVPRLRDLAQAKTTQQALQVALDMEANLDGHGGTHGFLLGQIMHLLHPTWFAVVNGGNAAFWRRLGYDVGGVANLELISVDYREALLGNEVDFNVIDDFIAVPWTQEHGE
jgi:hypothetical protein